MKKVVNDSQSNIRQTLILIKYYGFDLGRYTIKDLITRWIDIYPCYWFPLAVTEAIYQGRLKAVSIEQILSNWHKKGEVSYSFNREFINLIQPEANFRLQQERESNKIFYSLNESEIEDTNLSEVKTVTNQVNSSSVSISPTITKPSVVSIAQLNNLDSTNDSSQSFKKLKSLVVNNTNEQKREFYHELIVNSQ